MSEIDPLLLRDLLAYDPDSGRLTWKTRPESMFSDSGGRYTPARACKIWNNQFAGREAFTASDHLGYRRGAIFGRGYLAHRVIWAFVHGEWPSDKIDHVDGNPTNNRIANLRECSQAQNTLNRRGNKTGQKTSQYKGVYWSASINRWIARFREKHVGTFTDEHQAAAAYDRAARDFCLDFSRVNLAIGG